MISSAQSSWRCVPVAHSVRLGGGIATSLARSSEAMTCSQGHWYRPVRRRQLRVKAFFVETLLAAATSMGASCACQRVGVEVPLAPKQRMSVLGRSAMLDLAGIWLIGEQ